MSNKTKIPTVTTILKKARAKIKKGWTQGTAALDKRGNYIDATDKKAASFCAVGAVEAAAGEKATEDAALFAKQEKANKLLFKVAKQKTGLNLIAFNDAHTTKKKDVIALFDYAIKRSLR